MRNNEIADEITSIVFITGLKPSVLWLAREISRFGSKRSLAPVRRWLRNDLGLNASWQRPATKPVAFIRKAMVSA